MANDVTSTIVIDAKDKTGAAFKQVESGLNRVKGANESMATSVFKGVASWDLLKKGIGMATDFIKSSIEASIQAEREMAMVRQNVENAGIAFDSIKGKLGEYSKSMLQMGFDDEETATSVSKLILVTKDYDKALTLNNLAADLARSKGMALSEATSVVTQVTAGNVRVLKSYGIVLKEGASSADALAAMHDKVKGSMEAFANTTEGRMQVMSVTWGNFKEQIGDIFGPALNVALSNFNNFLITTSDNTDKWGSSLAQKLAILVNPDTWKLTAKTVATGVQQASWWITENTFGRMSDLLSGQKYSKSQSPIEKNKQSIIDLANEIKLTTEVADNLSKSINNTKPSFDGIGKSGEDAMKKQTDAMKTVLEKLRDYKNSINDIKKAQEDESAAFIKSQIQKKQSFEQNLADMIQSHKDKWQESVREIEKMEREGIKNRDDMNRLAELKRTAEKEFNIVQPYLNNEAMTKMAETSDVERLISSYRTGQAEDTVAAAERQAELVEKAQNITINFDLTNSTITDVNFIEKVKQELNKSLNMIRSTN